MINSSFKQFLKNAFFLSYQLILPNDLLRDSISKNKVIKFLSTQGWIIWLENFRQCQLSLFCVNQTFFFILPSICSIALLIFHSLVSASYLSLSELLIK